MASFRYLAVNAQGKTTRGVIESDSARQARQALREQGLFPREVSAEAVAADSGSAARPARWAMSAPRLGPEQKALFTRQLATLVHAGLPLESALETLSRQAETAKQRQLIALVRARVREGHSLADSLSAYPQTFDRLYVSLAAAGEKAGCLDQVMLRLADYLETSHQQRQKARMALVYPLMLTLVSIAIIIALMTFVVPRIVSQFEHAGQTLPAITRGLIWVSDSLRDWGVLLTGVVVLLALLVIFLLRQESWRLRWHRQILNLPWLGRSARALNTARLARTLAILNASGIPLLEALQVARRTLTNDFLRCRTQQVVDQVREGVSLHRALDKVGVFPPMMVYMVASGEASGELDQMLMRVADLQDSEFQQKVDTGLSLFEPVMILFMGGVVLTIVLAILLPIMQLNDVLSL